MTAMSTSPVGEIGILALQGDFAAHAHALKRAGQRVRLLRQERDFDGAPLRGLVLPGGESGVMVRLIERRSLWEPLARLRGLPTLATCAGMILLARRIEPAQPSLGWLDVVVRRNGYGRQLDSFEANIAGRSLAFIRAPRVLEVGPQVEVLMHCRGDAVLLRQGPIIAASFHPELSGDSWLNEQAFGRASPKEARPEGCRRAAFGAARACSSLRSIGQRGCVGATRLA